MRGKIRSERTRKNQGYTRLHAIELWREGLSYAAIAERLNAQGFTNDKKRWFAGTIRQLIEQKK